MIDTKEAPIPQHQGREIKKLELALRVGVTMAALAPTLVSCVSSVNSLEAPAGAEEAPDRPAVDATATAEALAQAAGGLQVKETSIDDFPKYDSLEDLGAEIGKRFEEQVLSNSEMVAQLGLEAGAEVNVQVGFLGFNNGKYVNIIKVDLGDGQTVNFVGFYENQETGTASLFDAENFVDTFEILSGGVTEDGRSYLIGIPSEGNQVSSIIRVDLATGNMFFGENDAVSLGNFLDTKGPEGVIKVRALITQEVGLNAEIMAVLAGNENTQLSLDENGNWQIIDTAKDNEVLYKRQENGKWQENIQEKYNLSDEIMDAINEIGLGNVKFEKNEAGVLQIIDTSGEKDVALYEQDETEKWVEAVPSVVAEAMGYGIPQDQAEKLANLENAEFEVKDNVEDGGVLITENGQDAYYYDGQTEFLVSVDRWPRITNVENIKSNEMTQEELFSDEYFAWLKYIASTLEFGDNLKYPKKRGVKSGKTFHIVYDGENNFVGSDEERAPFKRMEALAYIKVEEDGEMMTNYAVLPLFEIDETSGKISVTIVTFGSTDKVFESYLGDWANKSNITSIVAIPPTQPQSGWENHFVRVTNEHFGDGVMKGKFIKYDEGDTNSLSEPGLVVSCIILTNEFFK